MADIILIGPPPSSYTRTARMACVEKGVEHELRPIELGSEAHRALHPFAKVPILQHGEVTLYETQAILRYLDAAFEGPALVPAEPAAMGVMEQWISVLNCYLYDDLIRKYSFAYIRPGTDDGSPDRARIEAVLPELEREFGLIDRALEGKEWLAGSFSLADLLLAPAVVTATLFPEGGQVVDRFANVRRWLTAIEQRPSAQYLMPPKG